MAFNPPFALSQRVYKAEHIDREGGYGIKERVVIDEGLVAENLWHGLGAACGKFIFDNDECYTCRSEVFCAPA